MRRRLYDPGCNCAGAVFAVLMDRFLTGAALKSASHMPPYTQERRSHTAYRDRLALGARLLALAAVAAPIWGCASRPPIAHVRPHETVVHGQTRVDNYYWLKDRDDPAVIAYLKAENAHTEAVMRHTRPLQERLYNEFVARIKETDQSAPARKDDYYYYTREVKGQQYEIHCRKHGGTEQDAETPTTAPPAQK